MIHRADEAAQRYRMPALLASNLTKALSELHRITSESRQRIAKRRLKAALASTRRRGASLERALLGFWFLRRYDGVLRGFGYPKFHRLLRGNLYDFAGGRITSHASLAIHPDQPP